jgi:apolipoprotein N-acyltransferase
MSWLREGPPLRDDALAALAGALLPLAFAPFNVWPLALLACAALFHACRAAGTARAAWRGALFGLASFSLGVSWIHHSFQFAHIGLPVALALTAFFVVFLSLFPAAVTAIYAQLLQPPRRGSVAAALAFAALFVAGEWLRGWFLSGFTWLQLGYAQVDGPLAPALSLVGVYGVGLLGAAWACTALVALRRRRAALFANLGVSGLCAATVLFGSLSGAVQPQGAPLRVAILQGNVPQDQKWLPGMRGPTLQRYLALTRRHMNADLVVWPETAVPGTRPGMDGFLDALAREAREAGTSVLLGLPERDRRRGVSYNSVELLGRSSGLYRKQHLVPFGEYLPLAGVLGPIVRAMGIRVSNFSAGRAPQLPVRLGDVGLGIFICYEIAFGSEVIRRIPAAQVLVTLSNDAWFGDSLGPQQHLQMARARAIETRRYLVRATNTGLSAVVDPQGNTVLALPAFQVADGEVSVQPMAGVTAYARAGDVPAMAAGALMLVAAAVSRGRRGEAREA